MTDPSATVLSSFSSALAELVARTKPAIVSVHSHRLRASGFVWKPGLIVTADEALADEGEVSVKLADGTTRPASIAGRDHTTDIALLRFDGQNIAPVALHLSFRISARCRSWSPPSTAFPPRRLGTVSLVGGRWRSLRGGEIDARIELDVRLRPSHEGGLALTASGEAIGMAVQGVRRVLVIPSATIGPVAGRLETHGRIARGYLGVGLQPVKLDDGGRRRDGDECRSIRPLGCRRYPARRRHRRLERRETLRRAFADTDARARQRRFGCRSGDRRAGKPVRIKLTIGERTEA